MSFKIMMSLFRRLSTFQLIVLFCLTCFFLPAQQNKIDSLKKLIATDKDDSTKVTHLNKLSWSLKAIGSYEEARESGRRALDLAEKLNFKRGMAESRNMIGVNYERLGEYDKALEQYLQALDISKEINDKPGLASGYNNIALVQYFTGDFGKALENCALAINLNKETGNKKWLANNYNNIGNIYADKGDMDLALENYQAAKKIREEIGQTSDGHYGNVVNNIGGMYFAKKNYDKALELFTSALKIRQPIGDKSGIATSHISIGSLYFELMKIEKDTMKASQFYERAFENFSAAKILCEEVGDHLGLATSYLNTGGLYLALNKPQAARKELLFAFDLFNESNSHDLTKDACQLLARCDSTTGDFKGAYGYHKLFKQYSDSIFTEENSRKMAEMSTRFETEKKEEKIGQLEKEKKQTRTYLSVFGVLAVGVLFFGSRAYNNKRKLARLMSAESEHKEVLLQEVQHRINNNLQIMSSLLALQANSADDEKLHEYLKQSQNRIQSLSTMHELLYQNNSPLKINMREYINKVLDFHKDVLGTLACKVDMITNIADEDFATGVSVPLALIVNELVTNSIKYAFVNAENGYIKVSLLRDEKIKDKWRLTISDSGKGLPENDAYRKNSLGLRLVKIMTKQIKGTLTTSNSPGAAFEIAFNLAT
jgi:two-component system, sensor histidine kinase PdtaS